jgi:hypothetical protein
VKGNHDPAFADIAYVHEEICLAKAFIFAVVSADGFEAKPDAGDRPGAASRE